MRFSLFLWMAIASGATVANLYYNQPLLELLGQEFRASAHDIGFIPTLTQIGYALGMLLFVPLGDLVERRKLIVVMLSLTAVALGLAAIAPNLPWLVFASFAIGLTAIAAQVLVPLGAQLAHPEERGKVIGTIMSGLLIGILVARTVSGLVGATLGWRAMYWLASSVMLSFAVVMAHILPRSQPNLKTSYLALMRSLAQIVKEQPLLRWTSLIGAMSFGTFSAFWGTLAFLLAQPPYEYGSDIVGLFGLVGLAGAGVAPLVGKLSDLRSPQVTVGLGLVMTTLSFLLFWGLGYHLWGLVVGVILMDLGVQTAQISNQATIYSLPVEIHSRLNALYIMFYFVGGALGSFLGAYGWSTWGWSGVCLLSLGLLAIAFAAFWFQQRMTQASPSV